MFKQMTLFYDGEYGESSYWRYRLWAGKVHWVWVGVECNDDCIADQILAELIMAFNG